MVGAVKYVGRVGALAVALGVGGVIGGLAPAAADTPSEAGSGSARSTSEDATSSSTRGRTRAGGADRADSSGNGRTTRRAARPDTVAETPAGTQAATQAGKGDSRRSPIGDSEINPPEVTVTAPEDTAGEAADAGPVEIAVPEIVIAPLPVAAPAAALPRITPVLTPAAADVPVMTAAAAGAVAATPLSGLLDWLGGPGRTDTPAAAPLAWAAAAASRRELSAPTPAVAPAAAVTTGELSDQIAGFGLLAGLPQQLRDGIGQAAADWIARTFGDSGVSQVSTLISGLGSGPSIEQVLAGVGETVSGWWADSGLEEQLSGWVGALDGGLLGSPDVLFALADAAGRIATAADPVAVLPEVVRSLLNNPTVRGAVDEAVSGGLEALATEFGPAVSEAISGLIDDTVLGVLSGSLAGFLGQPGLSAALTDAAGQFATALLAGSSLDGAATRAWQALQADPAVQAVVDLAVSEALGGLLADTDVLGYLGGAVAGIVGGLAEDAALGELAGSTVTGFLGSPGVAAGLAGVAGDLAAALLSGSDLGSAATGAWQALQADPAVQAAFDVVLSGALGGLLADAEVLEYLNGAVSGLVTQFVGDSATAVRFADQLVPLMVSVILDGPAVVEDFQAPITELLYDLIVAADPASADLAPALAAAGFALLRAGLLGDDAAVPSTIVGLVTDDALLAGLAERIAGIGALAELPGELRTGLGEAAAYFVEYSFGNPAVVAALAQVFAAAEFPTGATEISEFLSGLLQNGFDIESALTGLLGPEVPAALTALIADTDVQQAFGAAAGGAVEILVGVLGEISAGIDGPIGAAVSGLLAAIGGDIGDLADSVLVDVLSQSGLDEAVLALLQGGPLPDLGSLLGETGLAALSSLLSDAAVGAALAEAVGEIFSGFAVDDAVRALVGDEIAALLASVIGAGPTATEIAATISDAVLGLLADSAIGEGLGAVFGSVVSGFLGEPGVTDALTGIAGDVLTAVIAGADPADALAAAWDALQADPDLAAALTSTLEAALDTLGDTVLGNATVHQALGDTVAALLGGLSGDPVVQSVIGDLLGSGIGDTIAGLLTDPEFGAATADALGEAVTDLLGYPGVSTALTDALGQIATAVVTGGDPAEAVQGVLQALAADPAVQAALNTVLPGYLDSILESADIREGLAEVAQQVVTDLLQDSGIADPAMAGAVGQIAEVAIVSLLANDAFGGLINDLASDILSGAPVSEVTDVVVQAVLRDSALQGALGSAIGQGIGSLLGDNLVGALVGQVAGSVATLVIGVAATLTLLFNPGILAAAATRPGGYFELFPQGPVVTVSAAV